MADIQLKHFQIPAGGDEAADEALNRFLRGHQVLRIRQEFVAAGDESVWCIAVRYAVTGADAGRGAGSGRAGVERMNSESRIANSEGRMSAGRRAAVPSFCVR